MKSAAAAKTAEAARLPIMLTELRLPTMKRLWAALAEQSNHEGWPAERFLSVLLGHEMAERETRRMARARADSQLPPGKSLTQFDFAAVPTLSKAHVMALAEADSWLGQGHNLLAFGPPGVGKTHLVAGLGHALIDRGHKVLFMRTSELVQRLQAARRDLRLPVELAKLDRFDLLILDDLSYARRDQAETVGASVGASARHTLTVSPPPGVSDSTTVPPCTRAISRTMARPKPLPS